MLFYWKICWNGVSTHRLYKRGMRILITVILAASYLTAFGAGILFGTKKHKKRRNQYMLSKKKEDKIVSFIEYKKYR